jgi:hypothetical protein
VWSGHARPALLAVVSPLGTAQVLPEIFLMRWIIKDIPDDINISLYLHMQLKRQASV